MEKQEKRLKSLGRVRSEGLEMLVGISMKMHISVKKEHHKESKICHITTSGHILGLQLKVYYSSSDPRWYGDYQRGAPAAWKRVGISWAQKTVKGSTSWSWIPAKVSIDKQSFWREECYLALKILISIWKYRAVICHNFLGCATTFCSMSKIYFAHNGHICWMKYQNNSALCLRSSYFANTTIP